MTTTTQQQPTSFQRYLFVVISVFAGVFLWSWYHDLLAERAHDGDARRPDFSAISDYDARKQSFINFLYPLIAKENHKILQRRKTLLAYKRELKNKESLTTDEKFWLERLAGHYDVDYDPNDLLSVIRQLLVRVNIIPPSLALAQAANETAWGISRFAKDGNSYFGQWCYRKGCGLVPKDRNEGSKHEVKSFASAAGSVKSYFNLLNSGSAFQQLRALRHQLVSQKQSLTGMALAAGLSNYSGRGEQYVSSIRNLIEANNLQDYTKAFNVSMGVKNPEFTF